ncbi:MAG TPA: hypothetical protein VNZ27_09370 [Rhodanobacter sp.]|jgi:hypothetical protein|nr:hypothetical protein [Rhodanobacter sp.]
MTTCTFDTLLYSLQDAIIGANAAIRQRREALFAATGKLPDSSEHVLRVDIPESPAANAPCSPVVIPLSLFRDRRIPSIAMMSVEFDCTIHFRKRRGQTVRELTLSLGRSRFFWLLRRPLHHVRISYLSANGWQPQVEIDGQFLSMPAIARATGD